MISGFLRTATFGANVISSPVLFCAGVSPVMGVMAIDDRDLDKLCFLARLALEEQDRAPLKAELTQMLDFVARLNDADVSDCTPMAHPQDSELRRRADVVLSGDRCDALTALAPAASAGLFLVPKVIE